jgi:hypothetical protein
MCVLGFATAATGAWTDEQKCKARRGPGAGAGRGGRARGRAVSAEHGASYRLPLVGPARIARCSSSHPDNRRTCLSSAL